MFKTLILPTIGGYLTGLAMLASITLTLLSSPAQSSELEYRLHLGLWTEHYYNDNPEYNESNDLVQITAIDTDGYFLTAATFNNSHFARSHVIGFGREFESEYIDGLAWGLSLAVVHGYEGYQETHHEGLIFAPVSYYKYKFFRVTIFGPAVNAGIELEF